MSDPPEKFPRNPYDVLVTEETRQAITTFVESVIPAEVSFTSKDGHIDIGGGVELGVDCMTDDIDSDAKLFIEDHRTGGIPTRSIFEMWVKHGEDGRVDSLNQVTSGRIGLDVPLSGVTREEMAEVFQNVANAPYIDVTADSLAEVISLLKGEQVFSEDGRIMGFPSSAHRPVAPSREQANAFVAHLEELEIPDAKVTHSYVTNVPVAENVQLAIYKEIKTAGDEQTITWGLQLVDLEGDVVTHLKVDSQGAAELITPTNFPLYEFGLDLANISAHSSFMKQIGEFEARELEAQEVLEFMKELYKSNKP